MVRLRLGGAVLMIGLMVGACGGKQERAVEVTAQAVARGGAESTSTHQGGAESAPKEQGQMSEQAVREALGAEARITWLEGVQVPGMRVFSAELDPSRGGYATGVVEDGGAVHLAFAESSRRVVAALGEGADAALIARVVGFLEGHIEPTTAIVEQGQIDEIHKAAWRRHVALPKRLGDDGGARRYEYWVECGEPPLWRSRLTVAADGSVSLAISDIWEILDEED